MTKKNEKLISDEAPASVGSRAKWSMDVRSAAARRFSPDEQQLSISSGSYRHRDSSATVFWSFQALQLVGFPPFRSIQGKEDESAMRETNIWTCERQRMARMTRLGPPYGSF